MEYFKTSQSLYKIKVFGLAALALTLIFGSLFVFKKAPGAASTAYYESLKISPSSLNGNTIWGGGETFDTVVAAGGLDAWAAFYSSANKSSGGLDPSGYLSVDGVPYNFTWTGASTFDGNDAIRLTSSYSSSRISLDTIGAYEKLYVLGTAGGPGEGNYANFAVRVNYTDGTTDETSYRLYDWYDSTPVAGVYKYPNLARRQVVKSSTSSGRIGSSSSSDYIYEGSSSAAPYLQSATISVDPKKLVSSVDLVLTGKNGSSDTSGIYCGIYAVTGMVNVSAPDPVETITVDNVTETTADISWNSVPNATSYRLDIALDPDFKSILPDYNNLLVRDISLTATGLSGDTTYYTRVRAENNEGQSISSNVAPFTTLNETIPPVVSLDGRPNLIQIMDLLGISATDASGVKNIEESLDGGSTWTVISESDTASLEISENGLYCFRATDIYDNVSEPSCLTYAYLDTNKPVIAVDTNGYTDGTWTNQPITLTVRSLTLNVGETKYFYSLDSGATWLDYSNAVVFNGETPVEGSTVLFKARSEAGIESDVVSVLLKKDSTAPTGEISGEEQSYNSFLNAVTFGLFFNRTVDFSIAPADALSGVASVDYLVSKTVFEDEASALAASGWTPLTEEPVSIQPEKDFVLYYKITDAAGNVTVLNTDGVVLDTTDALVRGYVSPDHTYPLEDGKTYYLTQKILITDNKALSSVSINGTPVELPASGILELRGNAEDTYNIVATDKAGNVTTATVHTSALSDLALGLTEDNFKTDDKPALETAISTLETLLENEGANASEDERDTISSLTDLYSDLIEKIDNLESELAAEHTAADSVPDIDHVTSNDRDLIETTLSDIKTTQEESGLHLTVPEQNDLLEDQRNLEEKLVRLDEVAEKQEDLEIVYLTDEEVIKTSDKAELEELLADANSLLAGANETETERGKTEEEKGIIESLLARIEEAVAAENTPDILAAESILPDGYTREDKDLLLRAEEDITGAISTYNPNYTEPEQTRLDDLLEKIHNALQDIEEQEQEEIRRNTFPTLELSGQTTAWTPSDDLQITAGDDYGVANISFSSDNGLTWTSLGAVTSAEQAILENGTYLVRAENLFGNVTEKSITYTNIDGVTPVLALNSYGYSLGSWTNLPISLSATNVAPNLSPVKLYVRENGGAWTEYTDSSVILTSEDVSDLTFDFYAESAAGLASEPVSALLDKDSVAPTGTVTSGENSWTSLLNSLTFGIFFNDTADFALTAEDDRSGLASAWYLVSDTELSAEELVSAAWLPATSPVSVNPERDFSVYYRLVDRAGNVAFLNTDGVVLDVTPPAILGYVNGETYPLSPDKTYYLSQKLLITDNKALAEVRLNGTPVSLENSFLTLPGNTDAVNELSVTDKAGNVTVMRIKTATIPELSDLEHKTINDSTTLDEAIRNLHDLAGENPSEAERSVIENLLQDYQTTQDEISDTEEKVARVEHEATTLPDADHVTSSDKEKIADLLEDIEEIFTENFNHLTEEEKTDLSSLKDDLLNKLKEITDFEEEKTDLEDTVNSYSPSTVTSDDKSDLENLKSDASELKDSSHASAEDKEDITDLIKKIDELLDRINSAEAALAEAEKNDTVPDVTPETVTPEDQTALENAQTGYAEALGVFDTNLSPAELLGATNRIAIIGSSLDILDQVAEFESLISRLPDPEDVDYAARNAIRAAEAAYNALSEYARTLVGPSLLSKYRAVIEAYRAYLAGSPILYAFETLDVFWWGIASFFIATTFLFVVSRTHRRYAEADSDKF